MNICENHRLRGWKSKKFGFSFSRLVDYHEKSKLLPEAACRSSLDQNLSNPSSYPANSLSARQTVKFRFWQCWGPFQFWDNWIFLCVYFFYDCSCHDWIDWKQIRSSVRNAKANSSCVTKLIEPSRKQWKGKNQKLPFSRVIFRANMLKLWRDMTWNETKSRKWLAKKKL